ncbi:myelin expression factor 2 isoform X1 [Puntigrus tetrazona]|uniref:myelin expression factor 2 isoform X1 n=1 Tax=Puntigrus tetrazona TaxID=1606681 RepID=UPI001C893A07|nr:myelin expression factor 2 isoform X1 [Puntigrus tetrazona]
MADAELTLDLTDTKHEESGDSPADEGETEPQQTQENTNGVKTDAEDKPEPKEKSRKSHRYHPYKERHGGSSADKKAAHRNRVFISNIPYDMKWQAIKDLMREKVGEVTYVELFKDGEGKSRGCGVVEFKDEEFVKKAIEVMSKHDLNGRPLNIKEDPDGEHAQRVLQRSGRMYGGGRGSDAGAAGMNVPPSITNNPNIPPEIISALRAGRLGTTVFVANLDFKVGWKKLKEVFSMAGTVRRADVKEDKDGKSRGMGTVTFEQPLEAVQAISMFNGQMLFDRQMHVKMDDKSLPPDDFRPAEKAPQLPRGLGGVGMGLGPGGQPINANRLSGGGVGSMGPGGMDGPGCSNMNRMSGMGGGFSGMDCMSGMGGFSGRDMGPMGRMGDMYRSGMGVMDRDFSRSDMGMNRPFGDSFGGGGYAGMGNAGMGPMGSGLGGGGMVNMGMDRMNSGFDRMGGNMDMGRGFSQYGGGSGHMGGMSDRGVGSKAGCQIFVRNLSYDLTWQKLKEKFSHCGQVMYAEIKMENGKSKGCGTVRFDSPESAEKACCMMNGTKINGREVDVRIDRNA